MSHPMDRQDRAAERDLRLVWRELVDERLPANVQPDWPVRYNHCFARILLDNAFGKPWRQAVQPPAWKNTPGKVLAAAIDLGEAVLAGQADLVALNAASLKMRGKRPWKRRPRRKPSTRRRARP